MVLLVNGPKDITKRDDPLDTVMIGIAITALVVRVFVRNQGIEDGIQDRVPFLSAAKDRVEGANRILIRIAFLISENKRIGTTSGIRRVLPRGARVVYI